MPLLSTRCLYVVQLSNATKIEIMGNLAYISTEMIPEMIAEIVNGILRVKSRRLRLELDEKGVA